MILTGLIAFMVLALISMTPALAVSCNTTVMNCNQYWSNGTYSNTDQTKVNGWYQSWMACPGQILNCTNETETGLSNLAGLVTNISSSANRSLVDDYANLTAQYLVCTNNLSVQVERARMLEEYNGTLASCLNDRVNLQSQYNNCTVSASTGMMLADSKVRQVESNLQIYTPIAFGAGVALCYWIFIYRKDKTRENLGRQHVTKFGG